MITQERNVLFDYSDTRIVVKYFKISTKNDSLDD